MIKQAVKRAVFSTPPHLKARHIDIDAPRLEAIKTSIATHFHTEWRSREVLSKERYEQEVDTMLIGRLGRYRKTYVPWIDAARRVKGLRILEVGCGTGASTVALAEQGADVTAIDIDEGAMRVAQDRLQAYKLKAHVQKVNACDMSSLGTFDAIIYNACLEHMTIAERLQTLREGWKMLASGGILVVVETPNRLWWLDTHTSKLPLFHALPDELAYQYAVNSPRENFREIYGDHTDTTSMQHFLRRGRGVSFHEFDIAIGKNLRVLSSLDTFLGWRERVRRFRHDASVKTAFHRVRIDMACNKLLRLIHPSLHDGWRREYLHLIIEKS